MKRLVLLCIASTAFLTGCAATVHQSGGSIAIPEASKQNLFVYFKENDRVVADEDWRLVRRTLRDSLSDQAETYGYNVQEASAQIAVPAPGVLLRVNVSGFRYVSTGARYGLGVMAGIAWVNSSVDFVDLESGKPLGTRTYDTESSTWEGVFSAMTEKQIEAISKQIIADIRTAKSN